MGKLNSMKEAVLADPVKAAADYIAEYNPEDIDGFSKDLLSGPVLSAAVSKFKEQVAAKTANPMTSDAEGIVNHALRDCIVSPMRKNISFLRTLEQLPFETEGQKKAFADWICSTTAISSVAEVKAIHSQATARAALLRELASAEPPPSADAVLARLAELQAGAAAADHVSVAAMTVALLRNAVPPITPAATQKLIGLLDSPTMRGLSGQLEAIAGADTLKNSPKAGRDAVRSLSRAITATASALSDSINAPWTAPRPSLIPLSAVQANIRAAVRQLSPALADALDAAHPAHTRRSPRRPTPARCPRPRPRASSFSSTRWRFTARRSSTPKRDAPSTDAATSSAPTSTPTPSATSSRSKA